MRLLHVIHTLNPASGGTAEAVRNFVLRPRDSAHAVLTLDHSSDPWINDFQGDVYCLGPGKGKYGFTTLLPNWLDRNLHRFDALVVHGCWQFHGLAVSRAASKARVPYYLFPHGMLDPYFNRASRVKRLKKMAYWRFERAVLENAAGVLFTCAEEQARAHQSFRFESTDHVVPLGFSLPHSNSAAAEAELFRRHPELQNKRVLLFLGRLHPKKGVDLLLRAFAQLKQPDAHLLIAGPASSESYLQELMEIAAPISNKVTFAGMLIGDLKFAAIESAETLVLPSHQDNFGFSAVEALACRRPVLLSNQVHIYREIVHDSAGFAAPDTEPGTLDVLKKWFALPQHEIAAMRLAARKCFDSRFRADIASARFLSVLQNAAAANSHDRLNSSLQLAHS